jgi:dihydrofolate reductase
MSKVVVFENVTLDGVMQAPGRPDEDRRGGFQHGGWADVQTRTPDADPVLASVVAESMANTGALLLGQRTYQDFYSFWPHQADNPFTEVLDNTLKYVASTTLTEPLPGRTPSCWRATPPRPWPGSGSSRARTWWCWAAACWCSR